MLGILGNTNMFGFAALHGIYPQEKALVDCASIILSITEQNEHHFKLLFQFSIASIIRASMR